VQGYAGQHYCPRMVTMNKPCYAAIKDHAPDKPTLIFVASRRQTRLTAFDIISYAAGDEKPKMFLGCSEDYIESGLSMSFADFLAGILGFESHCSCCFPGYRQLLSALRMKLFATLLRLELVFIMPVSPQPTEMCKSSSTFSWWMLCYGANPFACFCVVSSVERLFLNGDILVLVATATLAWGVNLPAHLVIVKGTEYFDGKTSRYVDYPLTDVLQMIGRAGRPGFSDEGRAVVMAAEAKKNFYMVRTTSP